ncbi:MAG: ABC-type Zn uptake system ZnuABC Zn-binding protein ZnuA [Glaciecola sp.]|jgi:ABC-type Zn uptake system ZnuABC Zn-binding protein ZnuA
MPTGHKPRSTRRFAGAVLLSVLLGACGTSADLVADMTSSDGRLSVATTVAPITSIVANIGGDRIALTGIVPEGTNSHTFDPKPSIAKLLATVDVMFVNGLMLEVPTQELAEANMKDGAVLVELGTQVLPESEYKYDFSFPREGGKPNPHLWTDPQYAVAYAELAAETLAAADPENADYYRGNLEAFTTLVDDLDTAMRTAFATIPAGNKKLLTYHDAYAYFADSYGWTIIGAIQVSDFEDPTAREVGRLINQIRDENVPAIFGSAVFPSPVLEQLAAEAGVDYVDDLRDDDLPGDPGSPDHSWLGLMRFDYVTMTTALGGDATALEQFEVRNVAPDEAEYPQ